MGNEADKKFTWVIKNFSSLPSSQIFSDIFVLDRYKWRLMAYPKGSTDKNSLSLYLVVADSKSLPSGWRRRANIRFHVINQISEERSKVQESQVSLDQKNPILGPPIMLPLAELYAKDSGFLINEEVKIFVEVEVLEVTGEFDVAENSSQPIMKKRKLNESVVDGFQISPTQEESVRRLFDKNPDIASKLRSKNRHLKSAYLNVLLGAIETLCQSPQELSDDDLGEASVALSYMAKGGFTVDWLEKKLEEVKENKKKVDTGKARLQQMEQELQKLNQKCLDLKALMEKEDADVSASNVAFSFDDVV